jgi:hypothetical protein
VESHEHRDGRIREGHPPSGGNDCPSSLPPDRRSIEHNFKKLPAGGFLFRVSTALIVLSLMGSCLAAPFLIPFFQLCLVPPILIAMVVGGIGGFSRSWWFTGPTWALLLFLYVWHDLVTNPFGYRVLYSTYVLNNPPQRLMYFHSWEHLYQMTIIPLTLGVAVLTHGWIAERRRRVIEVRSPALPESVLFKEDDPDQTAIKAERLSSGTNQEDAPRVRSESSDDW